MGSLPLTPAQKTQQRIKAPRPNLVESPTRRLSLTVDPFRSQLLFFCNPAHGLTTKPCPRTSQPQGWGLSCLGPVLTLLFILSMTQIESFVIPGLGYMKWAFLHLSIHLSILYPSIYPFSRPPIHPYSLIHSSICPPTRSSIHPCNPQLSLQPSIHPSIYPTTYHPSPHPIRPYVEQGEHKHK